MKPLNELPTIIAGPGLYRTRNMRRVRISDVKDRRNPMVTAFTAAGSVMWERGASYGIWHTSGRKHVLRETRLDIVAPWPRIDTERAALVAAGKALQAASSYQHKPRNPADWHAARAAHRDAVAAYWRARKHPVCFTLVWSSPFPGDGKKTIRAKRSVTAGVWAGGAVWTADPAALVAAFPYRYRRSVQRDGAAVWFESRPGKPDFAPDGRYLGTMPRLVVKDAKGRHLNSAYLIPVLKAARP